jgi:hypothetical protein
MDVGERDKRLCKVNKVCNWTEIIDTEGTDVERKLDTNGTQYPLSVSSVNMIGAEMGINL